MSYAEYDKLREEKIILNNKICELRKRLGIRSGYNLQDKLPPHIVKAPLFRRYKRFCQEVRELDVRISQIPKKDRYAISFQTLFVDKVKEKYPDIFNEIKNEIYGAQDVVQNQGLRETTAAGGRIVK